MHVIEHSWHYWLYKLTFRFSPSWGSNGYNWRMAIPEKVGLCRYVWRIILMTPIALLVLLGWAILIVLGIGMLLTMMAVLAFGIWGLFSFAGGQASAAAQGDGGAQRNVLITVGALTASILTTWFKARYRKRTNLRTNGTQLPLDSYELAREFVGSQWRRVCPVLTLPTRNS